MHTTFRPRQVYLASSWMAPVGRYNGKDKEALSFLEMAERCGEVFSGGPVRRRDIEAVVVGSQNPNMIASTMALNFPEAFGLRINQLIAAGLVLFIITLVFNMVARWMVSRRAEFSGAN